MILLALLLAAAPQIEHTPLTKAVRGRPVVIRAAITGASTTFAPQVYVRAEGKRYQGYPMDDRSAGGRFSAQLPSAVLEGAHFDYFLEARLEDGTLASFASAAKPVVVEVSDPTEAEAAAQAKRARDETAAQLKKAAAESPELLPPLPGAGPPQELRVESEPPGATVLLDGKEKGRTPLTVAALSGAHQIVLKLDGREVASDIQMPAEAGLTLRLTLPKNAVGLKPRLTVSSTPAGATLSIDGNEVGLTPWAGELEPGKRKLSLALSEYAPESRVISAAPNREGDLNVQLVHLPGPAQVQIATEPAAAHLVIDGKAAGIAPLTLKLTPGEHEVRAELPGFHSVGQQLALTAGESLSLNLTLPAASGTPLPPVLAIITEPVGATIEVDGKVAGVTPQHVTTTSGEHELRLSLEGYGARRTKLKVPDSRDYELRLVVSLKPKNETQGTPDPLDIARAQLRRALACYKQGAYDCALKGFELAYKAKPLPDLLFNIAQARRKRRDYGDAAGIYRSFAQQSPDSPMRPEAERMAALCDELAQGRKPPPVDEDTTPPALEHTVLSRAVRGTQVHLEARISDDRTGVATPVACWRSALSSEFRCLPLSRNGSDQYAADLPEKAATDGLAYYLEAFDGAGNGPSRSGSPEAPHSVAIDDEKPAPGRAPVAALPKPLPKPAPPAPAPKRDRTVTWLVAGAGAVALAGGGASGYFARQSGFEVAHARTPQGAAGYRELARRESLAANVLFGIGGALVAVAALTLVLDF